MRLLFVTQDFPPDCGGVQTYSWEMARRLADQVAALEVLAPNRPAATPVDHSAPFPVTRLTCRPAHLPFALLPLLARRACTQETDVALHAQWQTVGASVLSHTLTGYPRRVVCAAHGRELLFNPMQGLPALETAYEQLRAFLLRRVDLFLPVSHYTAGLLRDHGFSAAQTPVVPNGTDPQRFQPHDASALRRHLGFSDRPLLLTVGRLVRRKGVDTVLRALPAIAQNGPDVAYVVVGTGPDRPRLERLAARLGVLDRVRFVGEVNHDRLPLYYSAADLFVMPAREDPPDVEGFGLVFLEANACGTPVIGARTGGIPDAVVDGETGLLVPPNAPEALAEAATRVLTVPALADTLGHQGRRYVTETAHWGRTAHRAHALLATSLS
jgi:phosphatidylinositol alpha-1,6-mannosyltransferase